MPGRAASSKMASAICFSRRLINPYRLRRWPSWGAFGAPAVPIYFLAVFIAGLGWANWFKALCCATRAEAEFYVLVLIPEFPRYRPPAKGALIRPQDPAKATVPRPIAARALLNEREVAGFAGACICVGDLRRRS